MRDIHQAQYFTVFEGTYSYQCPIQRRAAPQAPANRSGKFIALLAFLALTATTTAGALTVRLRTAAPTAEIEAYANFVRLPTLGSLEDLLY